jgi:hypothetical protein
VSPFRRNKEEQLREWRSAAQTELARLQSLTVSQLAAEVMSRGFGEAESAGESSSHTQVSIAVLLCPDPPMVLKGDDRQLMERFGPLASESLQELEHASLVGQRQGKTSDLMFYTPTSSGLAALGRGEVDTILAARSTG